MKALWKLGNIPSQGATTLSAIRKINIPNTLRRINKFIIVTGMATIVDLQQLFGLDERILREPQHHLMVCQYIALSTVWFYEYTNYMGAAVSI